MGTERGMLSWRDSLATSFSTWSQVGVLPALTTALPLPPCQVPSSLARGWVTPAARRKQAGNRSDLKMASPLFRCKFSN